MSPAMVAIMPKIKKNLQAWRSNPSFIPDIAVKPNIVQPPHPSLVKSKGPFSGAPKGVDNDVSLATMRQNLSDSMVRGAKGRAWYDNSSQSANDLTGGREGYRDLYTGNIAVTSAGVSVPANQTFAVKGYNQAVTGSPISTGQYPANTGPALESLVSGQETMFGPKTGPFYEAVNVGNAGTDVGRPTNDIWMARAFDYRTPEGEIWSEGLGTAQHRFMDDEMNYLVEQANANKLGGFDDWTPERVQASIWVDTKARHEGKTIDDAMGDFSHNLNKYTTNINVESEPARGLGHLAGTADNPDAADALSSAQRRVMSTEGGQDIVSLSAGGLTQQTQFGSGYYKGNSVGSDVIRTLAAPGTGTNVMDPASRKLVEGIAATHGLLRAQESVGYNFLRDAKNVIDRNAAALDLGRVLGQDEMISIGKILDTEFGGAIIPTNTGSGINLLVVDDLSDWAKANDVDPADAKKVGQAWQKKVAGITKAEFDVKPQWMHNSGDLVGSFEGYMPSEYMKVIDQSGVVDGLEVSARNIAPVLEQVDAALIKEFPEAGTRNNIVQATREALISGGFSRVRDLIAQGVLPALVGGVALSALSEIGQSQRPQPGGTSEI